MWYFCWQFWQALLDFFGAIYWNVTMLIANITTIIDGIRGSVPSGEVAYAVLALMGRGFIFVFSLIVFEIPCFILVAVSKALEPTKKRSYRF